MTTASIDPIIRSSEPGDAVQEREFGGYLPLEACQNGGFFDHRPGLHVNALNSGRSAIALVVAQVHPKKLYIPWYNCAVVSDTLKRSGVQTEYYFLDENLEPITPMLGPDEWILCVNYFGNSGPSRMKAIYDKYPRIIFDNTQAFFSEPLRGKDCYNVYSCRKFFGVSDGAYLVYSDENQFIDMSGLSRDVSWERAGFLMRSVEEGTNAAYADSVANEAKVGSEILRMSVLTERILNGINYENVQTRRRANLETLKHRLGSVNQLTLPIEGEDMMIYPLFIKNEGLRSRLIQAHIYVPQWWKYLIDLLPEDTTEVSLSRWLYPLPLDQRYKTEDMDQMCDRIFECLQGGIVDHG